VGPFVSPHPVFFFHAGKCNSSPLSQTSFFCTPPPRSLFFPRPACLFKTKRFEWWAPNQPLHSPPPVFSRSEYFFFFCFPFFLTPQPTNRPSTFGLLPGHEGDRCPSPFPPVFYSEVSNVDPPRSSYFFLDVHCLRFPSGLSFFYLETSLNWSHSASIWVRDIMVRPPTFPPFFFFFPPQPSEIGGFL